MRSTIGQFLRLQKGLNVFFGSPGRREASDLITEIETQELRAGGVLLHLHNPGNGFFHSDKDAGLIGHFFAGEFESFPNRVVFDSAFDGVVNLPLSMGSPKWLEEAKRIHHQYRESGRSESPLISVGYLSNERYCTAWVAEFLNALTRLFPDSVIIGSGKTTAAKVAEAAKSNARKNKPPHRAVSERLNQAHVEEITLRFQDKNDLWAASPLAMASTYSALSIQHRQEVFEFDNNQSSREYMAVRQTNANGTEATFILANGFGFFPAPIVQLDDSAWQEFATVSRFLRPHRRKYEKEGTIRAYYEGYLKRRFQYFLCARPDWSSRNLNHIHTAMLLESFAKELDPTDFSSFSVNFTPSTRPNWLLCPDGVWNDLRNDFVAYIETQRAKESPSHK